MLKIGLTGNIAAGKSAVENMFKSLGIKVIDADNICHELYAEKEFQQKIIEAFACQDILENGKISRKKLGNIVFNSQNDRKKLEEILHPQIIQRIQEFFEVNKNEKYAVASVPLLFEAKMENIFDKIIIVCTDENTRKQRLIERNDITEEQALARIKSQMPQKEKIAKSDFVLDNSGTLKDTELQLLEILKNLKA